MLQNLEAALEDELEDLQEDPEWFSMALSSVTDALNTRCSGDPKADKLETWEACATAMQIGHALFVAARATTPTIECQVGHEKHVFRSGTGPWVHAGNWFTAFWLSCVCRERQRTNDLCQVPVSLLREAGGFDEYIYSWVEALQAYWLKRPELGDKLLAAVDGTDPEVVRPASRSAVLNLMYPPMNLLTQVVRGDRDRFTTELAKTIEWHKDYWTRDEKLECDSDGLVALGPLAISCLALDSGFTVEVESEYLPKYLLDGGWYGEFPT
ncbi:immunity 49 family protein [Streptomyces sp. NBC_00268]|uniref:immunity 49 family protein n=1 Tax=Streptomyces sp. NBC_00268 TaxID=2975695 RepID=UPI00224D9937|nr:immunity 49 family protein [Streptomyces sp. NBC_00268]MCX5187713.1 immunity 49 family protein [Streptomyces sp. NBC_00268]